MKDIYNKAYLEITNACNLSCSFCKGTDRDKCFMSEENFTVAAKKLRQVASYIYFHILGEPTLHPNLERFLDICHELDFKVIITTNGTLLSKVGNVLLGSPALHKVNISLHAFEANDLDRPFSAYLEDCLTFGKAAESSKLVTYRLWNQGGQDLKNREILSSLEQSFPGPWTENRRGHRLGTGVFLEYGDKFDWPDLSAPEGDAHVFCYGLRDQLGILCDGTVVPCCLDHEGDLALGNLFTQDLEEILSSPRAQAIYQGFSQSKAAEELCRKCGYARRFR